MVYEAILIKIICILHGYIQYLYGIDLAVFRACYQLRVLTQMPHALRGYSLGKGYRHDLLVGFQHTARIFYDLVYGIQRLLDSGQPPLVHHLAQDLIRLVDLILTCANHGKKISEILVALQLSAYVLSVFQIQIIKCCVVFFHQISPGCRQSISRGLFKSRREAYPIRGFASHDQYA